MFKSLFLSLSLSLFFSLSLLLKIYFSFHEKHIFTAFQNQDTAELLSTSFIVTLPPVKTFELWSLRNAKPALETIRSDVENHFAKRTAIEKLMAMSHLRFGLQ